MLINNFIVQNLIGVKGFKDTQCGFKLFNRKAAKLIFKNIHLTRWAFDVEILYMALKTGIQVEAVPVSFEDIPGGSVQVFPATVSFFRDFMAMFAFYNTGFWKLPEMGI